jgi:capsular polysaccharide biosynthesis protein
MVSMIDIPVEATVVEFESPAFGMMPPRLVHKEIIPPEVLRSMESSWNLDSFPRRTVRLSSLEHVYVVEEGLVFNAEGELYRETVTQHDAAEIGAGHAAVMAAIASGTSAHTGSHVLCKKRGADNFGHWLMEMLPKAYFAKMLAPIGPLRYLVPLVNGQLAEVIATSLSMLGIEDDAQIAVGREPIYVDRLLVVDGLSDHGVFMSPLVMNCIDAVAARVKTGPSRKLYITRGNIASRRFTNDAVVRHRAEASGYTLLDPATLSFYDQISAFKGATDIIGVMGAALTNMAFAPAGARITGFAPALMPDTFFWFIAGLKSQTYSEIRCRQSGPIRGVAPWDTELVVEPDDLDDLFSLSSQWAHALS